MSCGGCEADADEAGESEREVQAEGADALTVAGGAGHEPHQFRLDLHRNDQQRVRLITHWMARDTPA